MIPFEEITEQKISEKYTGLPQDLKDILSSINTSTAIENVAAKYQLDREKTIMLIQLVGLVILRFASLEDLKKEMKETIDINPSFIPLITDEIYQKIFLPVVDSLKKTGTAIEPIKSTAPTTPAPVATQPAKPAPPIIKTVVKSEPTGDRYREPVSSAPEVIDLRKKSPPVARPAPAPKPLEPITRPPTATPIVVPLPTRPTPNPIPELPKPIPKPPISVIPKVQIPQAPAPKIQVVPLIEANPHVPAVPVPDVAPAFGAKGRPQFIIRPPGLPPTDFSNDILDLRKDRGEF